MIIDDYFIKDLRASKEGLACPICGVAMRSGANNPPQVHHRFKASKGRYDVAEVCVVVCANCNLIKIECWSKEKFVENYGQEKYDYYVKATDIKESELKKLYPEKIERRLYSKTKMSSSKMPFGKESKFKRKLNGKVVLR